MTKPIAFSGSMPALVTPFKGGRIDEDALRALVDWQIESGSTGLVPVGTTGESPTLSHEEHKRVVEIVVSQAKGRVPVIAGAGSNDTSHAIEFAQHAEAAGADAVLVVTPYYNKPTQEGLYQHFKAVNDAVGIPIIIYNIPPRSVVDMSVETMARLYELKNIAGVKDATANLARVSLQRHAMGADFIQLSGEDMTALAYMAAGGHGCISVVANVAPKPCAALIDATLKGDYAAALKLQDRLVPLHDAVFREPGLCGAKHGLALLGRCEEEVRLPLPAGDGPDRQDHPRGDGVRRAVECLSEAWAVGGRVAFSTAYCRLPAAGEVHVRTEPFQGRGPRRASCGDARASARHAGDGGRGRPDRQPGAVRAA